jgi:hypothetical protein
MTSRRTFLITGAICASPHSVRAQASGDWQITIDDLPEFLRALNDQYRRARAPIFVDGLSFDVARSRPPALSTSQKQELTTRWQRRIARFFQDESYRNIPSREFEEHTGMSLDQVREAVIQAQPFGQRDMAAAQMGREIIVLVDEDPVMCSDRGALAVFIMAYYPRDGVQSDYGNILTLMAGIGGCGPANTEARQEIRRLKRELRSSLRGIVERR